MAFAGSRKGLVPAVHLDPFHPEAVWLAVETVHCTCVGKHFVSPNCDESHKYLHGAQLLKIAQWHPTNSTYFLLNQMEKSPVHRASVEKATAVAGTWPLMPEDLAEVCT